MDQSLTSTGLAHRDIAGVALSSTVTPDKLRNAHRLIYIRNALRRLIEATTPRLVVFEDYVQGFRASTGRLAHLGEIGGVLKLQAWEAGVSYLTVPPATLKLIVAGKGNADKKAMLRRVRGLGYRPRNDDEADAIGLMLIGEMFLGSQELGPSGMYKSAMDGLQCIRGQSK